MNRMRGWIGVLGVGLLASMLGLACGSESADDTGGAAGAPLGGSAGSAQAGGNNEGGTAGQGTAGAGQAGEGGTAGQGEAGTGQAGEGGTPGQGGSAGGGQAGHGGQAAGGTGGASGGAGQAGQGGSAGCEQEKGEPNDIESTAADLDDVTDCDDEGMTISGTLGPGDDDWFTWHAKDASTCLVDPEFTLTSTHNVTMCAYFECDKGTTVVTCPDGAEADTSINGRSGCCTSDSVLKPKLECQGTGSEDAWVWFHVGWKNNTECFAYDIDYHQ